MSIVTGTYPLGVPCWADLGTPDVAASLAFYGTVFGWSGEVGPADLGHYTTCAVRGRRVAGMMRLPDPGLPVTWTTYLATDDIGATADAARTAGGTVVVPPMDVADLGRMAVLDDPTGAPVALWQAGRHVGAELVDEPGGMVWNELMTRDAATARTFYADVFAYTYDDMSSDDFDYQAFLVGGRPRGGIMGLDENWSDDMPAHWHVTFSVADTDATAALVRGAGGAVASGPHDSPYGRAAMFRDPHGAVFSVLATTDL